MTTIKDKIMFLISSGHSQMSISEATDIPQSSISKILCGHQDDVLYSKGILLDALIEKEQTHQAKKQAA